MVRALEAWIIAVVSRDQQQIVRTQRRQNTIQPLIKVHQRLAKALWIAAVAIHGVKVNQVREAETGEVLFQHLVHVIHPVHVAFVMISLIDAATREDVVGLANRDHLIARLVQQVQIRLAGWRQAEVMPVGCPREVVLVRSHERPRDNPTDDVFRSVYKRPCVTADVIQFFQWDNVLMRRLVQEKSSVTY